MQIILKDILQGVAVFRNTAGPTCWSS